MRKYIPNQIESKWQEKWEEDKPDAVDLDNPGNKYYVLAEFAYPSGDLHMGHWFTWGGADIFARQKRMQGYHVFFPNGFDSFGLPAENAAIKRKIHPQEWTMSNIESMKKQYQTMGGSFEFDHGVVTCLPEYYKWNQWIFLKMLEKGVAYKGKSFTNWCPNDQTVLADEQVVGGVCERCGAEVTKKEIDQWFLRITQYADRLLWPAPPELQRGEGKGGNGLDWPKAVMEGQNDWIGRSEGVLLKFKPENGNTVIEVFTTALDTVFGVTFLVVSPEHKLLAAFVTDEQKQAVEEYVKQAKKKSELERKEDKDKTGVFTGGYVINPFNGKKVPVWVADYVLSGYGTGAVMGVPGHDARDHEFARKCGLEVIPVIKPQDVVQGARVGKDGFWDYPEIKEKFAGKSVLFNSGEYSNLTSKEAKQKMSDFVESKGLGKRQVQYHLHDWSISRQRYWGTPIPIIYCDNCGTVPVPEKDLPVELPYEVDYQPRGKPPLATNKKWLNVKCPRCRGKGKRDTDTMDGFFDNSWYFFRYLDNKNEKEIFRKKRVSNWLPLEIYFGGAEHTLGHTLYSRFFTKFLHDLQLIDFEEYAKRRINHGIVLGSDGEKMSKSRGNVVNPDDQVKEYGADAIRIHMAFFMPYEGAAGPWISERVGGAYRFLQRVWGLQEKVTSIASHPALDAGSMQAIGIDSGSKAGMTMEDFRMMHRTIRKVTEDIEQIKFNTAVASLMEWLNYLSRKGQASGITLQEYKTLLLLLAPFAPHITEELWQSIISGRSETTTPASASQDSGHPTPAKTTANWSIHQQSWPKFDNKYLEEEEVTIAVQVNGKVRDVLLIQKDILSNKEVVEKMALDSKKIQKFLAEKSVKKIVYIPGKIISIVVDK